MPLLIFEFEQEINVSAQVGDTAYYVPTTTSAQFQVNSNDIVEIGEIHAFVWDGDKIIGFSCVTTLPVNMYPTSSDYIFFSKDNKANQSNVLGYYAKVQLKNNSLDEAEIYSVGVDVFDSSK